MHTLLTFCIFVFYTIDSAYTQYTGIPGLPSPPGGNQCPPGMRYDNQQRRCVACGMNKYLDGGSAGVCKNCPFGTTSPEISFIISHCICQPGFGRIGSQQECYICELGKYSMSQLCLLCPPGKYSAFRGMPYCENCEAGKYVDIHGSGGPCQNCQIGKYRFDTGATTCISCLPGKFSSEHGARQKCKNCVAGKYSQQNDATVCLDCIAGKYSQQNYATVCLDCIAGKYSNTTSATSCIECVVGKYSEYVGAASSLKCQPITTTALTTSNFNTETNIPEITTALTTSNSNTETNMPETTTALTTSHFNTETNMPETTTALTSSQITLSNTNITTLISTTPLPMSELYQSIFSFQIDGNVDDTMKQIIRIETARNLNIKLRMVGLLQITSRPSARRLLSFTASFTITAVSMEESKLIEKNPSIDNLNTILSTASGGTITATNLVISRSYDTPKKTLKLLRVQKIAWHCMWYLKL